MKKKIVNVFLSTVTTGSSKDSDILNLSLVSDKGSLYIETVDNNLPKIMGDKYLTELFNSQRFSKIETYTEYLETEDILLIKDHRNILFHRVEEFLRKLSDDGKETILFWVNEPTAWFMFLNEFFSFKDEVPMIPEYINPYPMDSSTLFNFLMKKDDEELDLDTIFEKLDVSENDSLTSSKMFKTLHDELFKN